MLTAKQEAFAQKIIEGYSQADAYRSAYETKRMSDNAIYREASLLIGNPKVAQRLSELRNELSKPSIKTAQERMEWLSQIMDSEKETTADKLKASDQLNKMEGLYVQNIRGEIKMKKLEDML